jgi:hypothetical protein
MPGGVAPAIRIVTGDRDCTVPLPDAEALVAELRRLPADAYADAVPAAVIIEMAISDETPAVTFEPGERHAIGRVLEGMLVARRVLPDGLRCLREALLIESGDL